MIALASNAAGIPGVVLGVIFLVWAEPILMFGFGSHYSLSASLLRILTIGQIVCLATGPCELLLMMAGHQKATMRVNLVAAVVFLVGGSWSTWQFGTVGLASSIATVTATQNVVNCYLARRLLGIATLVGTLPNDQSTFNFIRTLSRTSAR